MRTHKKGAKALNLSYKDRDNELKKVFEYLQTHTATATMTAVALNIYRPNLCRRKRDLQKAGLLCVTQKALCKITKHKAEYLTTNPDLFTNLSQSCSNDGR